jgi:uncharacterized membrane protein
MTQLILTLHIVAGSAALLSMFIPIVAKKGGLVHRRAGWVFVGGMTVVSVTALLLSASRFLTDPSPEGRLAGAFLFFVAILTGAGVSAGVRVLRAKRRTAVHRHAWDLGVAVLLTLASLAAGTFGLATGQHLFTGFSVIGLLSGGSTLLYWLRPPTHPMHWWFEHMGAMLGSCIAATTAFLVVNASNLGAGTFSFALWFSPTLIGVPVTAIWTGYYRRKFARSVDGTGTRTALSPTPAA